MESSYSYYYSSLIFSLLLAALPLLSLLYFYYATRLGRCSCHVCSSFVSGEWRDKFRNLPDWYTHLLRDSPSKTIHIHVLNNTITAHPKNVDHMLRAHFDNYPKGPPMSSILGDLLGRGIFIVDGEHWRFQRKLASLELGSLSIRAYAHQVLAHEIRANLIPSMKTETTPYCTTVDLQEVFRRFSFGNICRFSFGVDLSGLGIGLGLMEAFDEASRLSAQRALHTCSLVWRAKRLLNVGSERRLREAIRKVDVVAGNIIKERRRKEKEESVNKIDLLSRFMESVADDKYLRDIVVSFLLAGRDTVASSLTCFFYLLARNPEVEARILKESDRVLAQQARAGAEPVDIYTTIIPSLKQMGDMQYLQAALYESLRLYPPVQMDSKWAKDEDLLPDGTQVQEGTRVSYHPYAMGRMEDIWGSDCLEFKPERWLNQDGFFRPENPYKYPVFQAGVRVCLGKDIAVLAMKAVALALIRQFEIRLADPEWTPRFAPGLTATLQGGLPMVVKDRCLRR